MEDRHARHRRADADRRRRPSDGHRTAERARFERLASDAAAALPPPLRDELALVRVREVPDEPGLLAVAADSDDGVQVTLFRRPLELRAVSKLDLLELLRDTLAQHLSDRLGPDGDA